MCKFHKDVAREIATNPADGSFDAAVYSVALTAIAKFRIEQYMPSMFGTDGYSKYALGSDRGREAFAASGLAVCLEHKPQGMGLLRHAMRPGLSLKGLNLPKNPVRDVAFLDEATVDLYEGYTGPGYAAGELQLKTRAHKPEFEPIRQAAAEYLAWPGVEHALRVHFEHSMARVFTDAHNKTSPALQKLYNKMPEGLRSAFKSCAMCVGPGAGGALVSHAGCIAVPVIAGATGTAVSGGVMAGMMMVGSPLIAAGVTYGLDRWRGRKTTMLRLAGAVAIAFGVAAGINVFGGHDHHAPEDDHHHHHQKHEQQHHQHHAAELPDWLDGQICGPNRDFVSPSLQS